MSWDSHLLTVDTQLDLSASITHGISGGANVDACIIRGGVGEVEVPIWGRL